MEINENMKRTDYKGWDGMLLVLFGLVMDNVYNINYYEF